MAIVGDEYRQAISDDPADRALEWYRNSKQYPDNPNLGVWGRINRAFQDGWAMGYVDASVPAERTNSQLEAALKIAQADALRLERRLGSVLDGVTDESSQRYHDLVLSNDRLRAQLTLAENRIATFEETDKIQAGITNDWAARYEVLKKENHHAVIDREGREKAEAELHRLREEHESCQEAYNAIFDELHALKKNGVWALLETTPDGHDSPNKITLHPSAEYAIKAATFVNEGYRQSHEPVTPIHWTDDPKGGASYGRGYLYCYDIVRFDLPNKAVS